MGKGKGNKGYIPADRDAPQPGKQARTSIDDPQREQSKPVWRMKRMALDGPFGWDKATADVLRMVHSKLASFETMTWGEFVRAEKQHHYLTWDTLSKEARDDFAKRCREGEQESIFSFKLTNVERLIGLRVAGVFEIIWWDPEHGFCPSTKKNT